MLEMKKELRKTIIIKEVYRNIGVVKENFLKWYPNKKKKRKGLEKIELLRKLYSFLKIFMDNKLKENLFIILFFFNFN